MLWGGSKPACTPVQNMSPAHPKPARAAPVPQGRARRRLHMGRAVGEMAAGAAAEGMARLARGENLALSQLMLTLGNARRRAERLSTMRGAVMKVGQLMSMDGKTAATVNGALLKIGATGGVKLNGEINVVKTDIACTNGVIHVIDSVLLPSA